MNRNLMKKGLLLGAALLAASASARPIVITFLHNNDVHARVEPVRVGENTYGGYARTATLIDRYRKSDPNPVVLSAGDVFQGTLYFNVYEALADLALMERIGFQAMAVGNHEFDRGVDPLATFAQNARFPLLAANLDVSAEPKLKDRIKPYAIMDVAGEKLGIVGAVTPDTVTISNPGPTVKFLPLAQSVQAAVDELQAQGVNKIALLSHIGFEEDRRLAQTVRGLDVVIGGHSHTLLGNFANKDFPASDGEYPTVVQNADGNRTLVVHAWEWGKVLGRLKVLFSDDGRVLSWQGAPVAVGPDVPEDAVIARTVTALAKPLATLRQTQVSTAGVPLVGNREIVRKRESNLANLLADSLLARYGRQGAVLALINGGNVRASIPQGPVTMGQLLEVQPFGNTITVMDLTGEQLRAAIEHGVSGWEEGKGQFLHVSEGVSYTFDPTKPAGSRVQAVTLKGQPIDPATVYRVAVNTFLATGGDNYQVLKNAEGYRVDTGDIDVDVLADFVRGRTLAPQTEGRIVIVNEPR